MMTIKEAAEDALIVQDAVNLSGVIHTWSISRGSRRRARSG